MIRDPVGRSQLPMHHRRKVAVPVPEGLQWPDFLNQVRSKLRLSGVKEVILASVSLAMLHVQHKIQA